MFSRNELIQKLDETFDILIIGGGATGCGIALDAICRGYKVALVERSDFASGTSSKSTKLVHGGVRYLEQAVKKLDRGQYHLVNEALHERAIFLKIAPHLTRPLPIFTPLYKFWEKPYYRLGLKMYDWLAGHSNIGKSRSVSATEAKKIFPDIKTDELRGGVLYFDGQFDDARMNLTLAKTALYRGAVLLNYMPVLGFDPHENGLKSARVRDSFTQKEYQIKAKCIVNATGPFVDSIRQMDDPTIKPLLTVSSGAHVVLKQKLCPDNVGFLIPKTEDGRVLFLLPWQNHTLAGTTDQPAEVNFNPKASADEITYILEHLTQYFRCEFQKSDILSSWSGLRPLVSNPETLDTAALSRDHVIFKSKSGLVTVAGGKWTTYRKMAADTIDSIIESKQWPQVSCTTDQVILSGANGYESTLPEKLQDIYQLPSDIAFHLAHAYGQEAHRVMAIAKNGFDTRLDTNHPFIEAEVIYAMQDEMALRVSDILCRRTRLAFLDKEAALRASTKVATLMQKHFQWSEHRLQDELAHWADIF